MKTKKEKEIESKYHPIEVPYTSGFKKRDKELLVELQKRILIHELWQEPGARKFVKGEDNCFISHEVADGVYTEMVAHWAHPLTNLPFFDTEDHANAVIAKYGDRLKILL